MGNAISKEEIVFIAIKLLTFLNFRLNDLEQNKEGNQSPQLPARTSLILSQCKSSMTYAPRVILTTSSLEQFFSFFRIHVKIIILAIKHNDPPTRYNIIHSLKAEAL